MFRDQVAAAFLTHRRWWGEFHIRVHARLDWMPLPYYREILAGMVELGQLIKSHDPEHDEFPRYFLTALIPPPRRSRWGKSRKERRR
jgi:hypothetical protein